LGAGVDFRKGAFESKILSRPQNTKHVRREKGLIMNEVVNCNTFLLLPKSDSCSIVSLQSNKTIIRANSVWNPNEMLI
jgi:hypothetical protein